MRGREGRGKTRLTLQYEIYYYILVSNWKNMCKYNGLIVF